MNVRTQLSKVIILFVLLISLTQNVCGKSASEHLPVSLADSTLKQLADWEKQDSLEQWMGILKNISKERSIKSDISEAIALLSDCIEGIWRNPNSEKESIKLAWIYVNRAYLYSHNQGDYLAAKTDYLNALQYFESCDYSDFFVARYLLEPLGNIYTRHGENEQAIVMLEEFQRISKDENQLEAIIDSYNDLGRAYTNKKAYEKTFELLYQGSLIDPTNLSKLGLLESSKAEVELELGAYDEGIKSAQLAIEHLGKATKKMLPSNFLFVANNRNIVGSYITLGKLYIKKNEFAQSQFHFEKAWGIAQNFYQGKHRRKAKILNGLGDCYRESEHYLKSINFYHQALIESVPGFDQEDIKVNPPNDLLFAEVEISESLTAKARLSKMLFEKTEDQEWLELSVATYLTYFRWNKKLRAEQLNIQSKLDLSTEIHGIAEETLEVIYMLKNLTNEKDLAEVAFQIIEQTKGVILSESDISNFMETNNQDLKTEILALNVLRTQKWETQELFNSLKMEDDKEVQERLKISIEDLDRKIQIQDFQLREDFPSYDKIRLDQNDSVNFDQLRVHLKERKYDLWSYFLGEEHLYLIKSTKGEFEFIELDHKMYENLLPQFLEQLNSPNQNNPKMYAQIAVQLFNVLLPNNEKESNENWLILPDGNMNLIPFEALVTKESTETPTYKKLPYVILDHTIHYSPSIKFVLQNREYAISKKSYLGLAPIFDQSNEFAHLPHSEEEVMFAKELFSGDVFLNDSASKSKFITTANQYELIHLSTHAGLGSGKNNDGWIAFQSEEGYEKLLTPELLQLNLSARLVVINGCETGLGEIFKGEGMLSMARGFIQSGAQSAITNLWQVNHASNARLMRVFYQELHASGSPAISLRNAKIAYINDQEIDTQSAHPFYWAASVLIGTNNEMTLNADESWIVRVSLFCGLGVLVIVIGFFLRRKLKA
ncbi:MAG: CHAT domain-containing protein [Crocinitomix sp.]|jgi:CHAT domain-containing protein